MKPCWRWGCKAAWPCLDLTFWGWKWDMLFSQMPGNILSQNKLLKHVLHCSHRVGQQTWLIASYLPLTMWRPVLWYFQGMSSRNSWANFRTSRHLQFCTFQKSYTRKGFVAMAKIWRASFTDHRMVNLILVEADELEQLGKTGQFANLAQQVLGMPNCQDCLKEWPFESTLGLNELLQQVEDGWEKSHATYLSQRFHEAELHAVGLGSDSSEQLSSSLFFDTFYILLLFFHTLKQHETTSKTLFLISVDGCNPTILWESAMVTWCDVRCRFCFSALQVTRRVGGVPDS